MRELRHSKHGNGYGRGDKAYCYRAPLYEVLYHNQNGGIVDGSISEARQESVGQVHHPQGWREGCKEKAQYPRYGTHKGSDTMSEAIHKINTKRRQRIATSKVQRTNPR